MPKKRTHEEFINKLHNEKGDIFTVLSKFNGNKNKIKVRHNKCGNEWDIFPSNLLKTNTCPKCSRKAKSMTKEEFLKRLHTKHGNEYSLISEFISTRNKVKIRHNDCGHEWEVMPLIIIKHKCPICSNKARVLTNEEFVERINNKHHGTIEILSEYVGIHDKLTAKHVTCGHEWEVTPGTLLNIDKPSDSCPNCCRDKTTKTHEDFVKQAFEKYGEEYVILSKYKSAHKKIKVKHTTCGTEYSTIARKMGKCPLCTGAGQLRTHEDFIKRLHMRFSEDKFTILGKYINSETKILVRHNKCGYEWEVKPNSMLNIKSFRTCPRCHLNRISKGEAKIEEYLLLNNIKHERQFSFKDCVYKRPLKFDFIVYLKDTLFLIEYDGTFHFETNRMLHEKDIEINKTRDQIKTQYCLDNNIALLRIHHKDKERIYEILDEYTRCI